MSPFIKWANPYLKKFFKLNELDIQTKERVTAKQYPGYFGVLYGLWVISLLETGMAVLLFMMVYGQNLFPKESFVTLTFVGLINMIGVWFIFGAILNIVFWQISSINFRDYVVFRQLKSGWGYDFKQQIIILFKIGFVYYLVAIPVMIILLAI